MYKRKLQAHWRDAGNILQENVSCLLLRNKKKGLIVTHQSSTAWVTPISRGPQQAKRTPLGEELFFILPLNEKKGQGDFFRCSVGNFMIL